MFHTQLGLLEIIVTDNIHTYALSNRISSSILILFSQMARPEIFIISSIPRQSNRLARLNGNQTHVERINQTLQKIHQACEINNIQVQLALTDPGCENIRINFHSPQTFAICHLFGTILPKISKSMENDVPNIYGIMVDPQIIVNINVNALSEVVEANDFFVRDDLNADLKNIFDSYTIRSVQNTTFWKLKNLSKVKLRTVLDSLIQQDPMHRHFMHQEMVFHLTVLFHLTNVTATTNIEMNEDVVRIYTEAIAFLELVILPQQNVDLILKVRQTLAHAIQIFQEHDPPLVLPCSIFTLSPHYSTQNYIKEYVRAPKPQQLYNFLKNDQEFITSSYFTSNEEIELKILPRELAFVNNEPISSFNIPPPRAIPPITPQHIIEATKIVQDIQHEVNPVEEQLIVLKRQQILYRTGGITIVGSSTSAI